MTYEEFCDSRIKWFGNPQQDLVHSAMGLLGECVEYSEASLPSHKMEELGDLEFYFCHANMIVQKLAEKYPFDPSPLSISREEHRIIERDPEYWITHHAAEYHDFAKKAWVYQKPLNELTSAMHTSLRRVELCLFILANKNHTTREIVKDANKTKLEARYPTGYSDAAAQARADKVDPLNSGHAFV